MQCIQFLLHISHIDTIVCYTLSSYTRLHPIHTVTSFNPPPPLHHHPFRSCYTMRGCEWCRHSYISEDFTPRCDQLDRCPFGLYGHVGYDLCTYACACVRTCVRVCVCACVYMYVCVCSCVWVSI